MLDRIMLMMTPMARMWLRAIFQIFLLLVVVTGILLFVQYRNSGWPFNDEQVVADKTFRAGKSSVENLLVGGNERQLWDKVEQIADDPKLPDAVRLEHMRDRIRLLTKIKYANPDDPKTNSELISALALREKYAVQFDERTLTLAELEELSRNNLEAQDSKLAQQAATGVTVAKVAQFARNSNRELDDLKSLIGEIEFFFEAQPTSQTLAETICHWCYLLDEKIEPELSRQFKEWVIARLMLSSQVGIRDIGAELSQSLADVNFAAMPRSSYLLSYKVGAAKEFGMLLQDASRSPPTQLMAAKVIEQANYQLMVGRFNESDKNFNRLENLIQKEWVQFKPQMEEILSRYRNIGAKFDVKRFEDRDGAAAAFASKDKTDFRFLCFVSHDTFQQSTGRFAEVVSSFRKEHWGSGRVQLAIVFMDDGNQEALERFWSNPVAKMGLESWKLSTGSERGIEFLANFPVPKLPYLVVLDGNNELLYLDPSPEILKEIDYSIRFGR